MKIKKRDKFIIGGIIVVALSKLPTLKDQTFDIAGFFGLIIMGAIAGGIAYAIFGREKKENPETPQEIETGLAYKEENLWKEIKNPVLLKGRSQDETSLLECGKLNYIRLKERFKHDDIKRGQVNKDWFDYLEALKDLIYEREMLDISTAEDESNAHFDSIEELHIKIQEIEKRFKELLGSEYIEPEPLKKSTAEA